MRYTTPTKHSCRTSFSRVGLRGFLLTAGILSLLIWSLGSSAGTSSRSTSSTPKSDAKTAPAEPKAKLEPIAMMAPFFKAAGNLDQVRNGTATAPIDPPDWVNGNAGASNAHYREGESIPYRLVLTGLSPGAHEVFIEWDTRHSSVNAIDYITYYDRIAETVQPLLGAPGTYATPVITQIPTPGIANGATIATNSFLALSSGDQKFTSYNATNVVLEYDHQDALTSAAQTTSGLKINFTTSVSNVLFAWGGHIASSGDWGAGNSAGGISGSPYHTRLISLDGSGGNQDRSLSAAAVLPPLGCSLVSDSLDVCAGGSNTHTSTAVVGQTYSFSLVNNGGNAAITGTPDTDPAGGTVSAQVTTSGAGSYTITLTTTTAGGTQTCPATVTVHAPPAADAGAASYEHCQTDGLAFAMSAATSTVPTGGTRTWTVSPANAASISDAGAANPTITLNSVGTVTATLTVTGPFCTTASDSSTLTVSGTATAAAGPDQTVCASSPAVTLAGSTSGSATSASWSGGGGSFNPNNSTLNAVYTPSAAEVTAGSATLTLTTNDPAGSCGAGTDTITITINPNPTVEISLADACAGTAHLHATASGGTGPYIYSWKKNNVAVVQANSADLTLSGPGSYSVSVTDNSSTTCGSAPDTFVVCYTEGAVASTSPQGPSNSLNAAIKPKSDTATFLARLTTFVVSTFATSIF